MSYKEKFGITTSISCTFIHCLLKIKLNYLIIYNKLTDSNI